MNAPLSMLDVIHTGATATAKRELARSCPSCDTDAPLATQDIRTGTFFIMCEDEDCECPLYVEGATLALVWANWNDRVSA